MKVLHLISGGDNGGAKTHLITLLKKLIQDGISVELLCIMEGPFTRDAKKANIPITIIEQKTRFSMKPISDIRDYIKNGNFDIVHCHGARANYIAWFIKKKFKVPFITTLHSDYKLDFKDSFYKQAIFMPINSIALRNFDYILAVTKSFKDMLIERGFNQDKIRIIYNGINMNDTGDFLPPTEFLKQYNIDYDENKIYIGIVARLQIVKGLMEFLNASKILVEKHKNLVFLIAGNGDMEKEMKTFINKNNLENNVYMLGFVTDMSSFYNSININTLTSYSESFPYALLEGARQKKTAVATDVGGISEMIQTGKTGFVVPPCDSNAIAEKLEEFINQPELISKFGESFHDDVLERFSDQTMAKTHIELYESIISEYAN